MAKIHARGAVKMMQAHKEWTDKDGYRIKRRYALRSDGAILVATDLLSPERAQYGSRGWNRGSYSIFQKLTQPRGTWRDTFLRFAEREGLTVTKEY